MSWSPELYRLRTFLLVIPGPPAPPDDGCGYVGNVVHYEPSNVLILTGRASTINKLIEVIKRVDVIGTEKQQIIHLEYASAEDLAEILNQLISESHGKARCQPSPRRLWRIRNQLSYHQWTGKSTPAHHFITEKP